MCPRPPQAHRLDQGAGVNEGTPARKKGETMSTTSGATQVAPSRSFTEITRAMLIALAIVVLAAVALVAWRAAASTGRVTPRNAPAVGSQTNNDTCHVGLPC